MGATLDTGYLYGQLNNYVEYLRYDFKSTDNTLTITAKDDYKLDFNVNTTNLITLKQVKKDLDPSDDPIKYYSLYAYNKDTGDFDIKIGQEIVIDTSLSDNSASKVEHAYVKVGEEQVYDPETGEPMVNDDGTALMKPILQQVVVDVSKTGQLVLDNIPASAIVDTHVNVDTGEEQLIESVLDGNAGGDVY